MTGRRDWICCLCLIAAIFSTAVAAQEGPAIPASPESSVDHVDTPSTVPQGTRPSESNVASEIAGIDNEVVLRPPSSLLWNFDNLRLGVGFGYLRRVRNSRVQVGGELGFEWRRVASTSDVMILVGGLGRIVLHDFWSQSLNAAWFISAALGWDYTSAVYPSVGFSQWMSGPSFEVSVGKKFELVNKHVTYRPELQLHKTVGRDPFLLLQIVSVGIVW